MHDCIKQFNKLIWSLWLRTAAVNGYQMELRRRGMIHYFTRRSVKVTRWGLGGVALHFPDGDLAGAPCWVCVCVRVCVCLFPLRLKGGPRV